MGQLEAMDGWNESDHRISRRHFLVIDWNQEEGQHDSSRLPGWIYSSIDTAADAPDHWATWIIPGDTHPDQQASGRVVRLVYEAVVREAVEYRRSRDE